MLGYFPQIYPGELLYSVLARYHRHTGALSPIHTMEALFGRRLVIADPDLPGALDALVERIPSGRGLGVERLIDELTLLPYYSAFQPPEVRAYAREKMAHGQVDGLHLTLGIAAFRVGRVTRLRFCHACLEQMLARHGECYWRRDHQLPSVLVCPDHGAVLQESHVLLPEWSRHAYMMADDESCPDDARPLTPPLSPKALASLLRLSRASAALLEHPGPARTLGEWTAFYRARMQAEGLAYSATRMNQVALDSGLRHHFGVCLDLYPNVMQGGQFVGAWPAAMVRKHRKAIHPLYHLLLQDLLVQMTPSEAPFGDGPWPCRNPLHRRSSSTSVALGGLHHNHGHVVGVFTCRCGYIYTRCFWGATKTLGPPRFQAYGPLLKPELQRLIARRCSLREAARRLALDPKTVARLAGILGIPTPWKASQGASRIGCAKPVPRRKATAHRKSRRPSERSVRTRRDWQVLDGTLCEQVNRAVIEIRECTPPVRVSVARIERQLGKRGWFDKRREKLPRSMAVLGNVAEDLEEFQRRRVTWFVDEISRSGRSPQPWRVMRQAGLTPRHLPMITSVMAAHRQRHQGVV